MTGCPAECFGGDGLGAPLGSVTAWLVTSFPAMQNHSRCFFSWGRHASVDGLLSGLTENGEFIRREQAMALATFLLLLLFQKTHLHFSQGPVPDWGPEPHPHLPLPGFLT